MRVLIKRFAHTLNDNNSISIPTDLFNDSELPAEAIGLMLHLYASNLDVVNHEFFQAMPVELNQLEHALAALATAGYIELLPTN